jgi:hypothetical protein
MGYHVSVSVCNVVIPKAKVAGALKAINLLHEEAGEGHHFSWVDNPSKNGFEDLVKAIEAWRYSAKKLKNGNVEIVYFLGEKLGDDEILFTALAPFIKGGGAIEYAGEDAEQWRYEFVKGKMVEKHAVISWE